MDQIFKDVKRVYEARSAIVHGLNKSKYADLGGVAALSISALRTVLRAVIHDPEYLDVYKIDELMLRSEQDTGTTSW